MSSEVCTRRLIAASMLLALALTSLIQTGCTRPIRRLGIVDELAIAYRDRVWAQRAFNLRFANCNREYADHFRNGFCAGYSDVCGGGDGFLPALPPDEYQGYEYQCAEGSRCVDTWFEGYPEGVAAAREEKAGSFNEMHVSRMIDRAITQQNAPNVLPSDVPVTRPSSTLIPPKRDAVITKRFGNSFSAASRSVPNVPEVQSRHSVLTKPTVASKAVVTAEPAPVAAPRTAKLPPVVKATPTPAVRPLAPIKPVAVAVPSSTKVPPIVQGTAPKTVTAPPIIRGRKIDPSTNVSRNEIPLPMAVRSTFDTRTAAWPVTNRR